MAKRKTLYVCQECGYSVPKWLGKCPGCGKWNTLVEELEDTGSSAGLNRGFSLNATKTNTVPRPIKEITTEDLPRFSAGSPEMNRVLGGGRRPDSFAGSVRLCAVAGVCVFFVFAADCASGFRENPHFVCRYVRLRDGRTADGGRAGNVCFAARRRDYHQPRRTTCPSDRVRAGNILPGSALQAELVRRAGKRGQNRRNGCGGSPCAAGGKP